MLCHFEMDGVPCEKTSPASISKGRTNARGLELSVPTVAPLFAVLSFGQIYSLDSRVSRPGAQRGGGWRVGGKGNIRVCRGRVRGTKEGWGHGVWIWGEGQAGGLRNGFL